ncbi:phosphate acetyltransferase [Candidatus Woesearchaeota archaeon]|nr:phosphate acetyltransferase [Candidatus Woesearchaeota archaeon]
MKNILENMRKIVRTKRKIIVFPESEDIRVLKACRILQKENICDFILLGNAAVIKKRLSRNKISLNPLPIIDPQSTDKVKHYAHLFAQLCSAKRVSYEKALNLIKQPMYFATMMLYTGEVDGVVSGSNSPTADTLRPALHILKTKQKFHRVSGVFLMMLQNRLLLFADCAVQITPSSRDLSEIALDSAKTAKMFGIKPKIAFLSFSTKGSASNASLQHIRDAVKIVRSKNSKLIVDGELQVDAALDELTAVRKNSVIIKGDANVLIFPDLNSANIAYKLVERLAKAHAVGPILQGLAKPVNDLSRGCSAQDIVDVAIITCYEAIENSAKQNSQSHAIRAKRIK